MPEATADRENFCAIPLDPNDVFQAISNCRRRRVLLSLDRSESPTTAGDLAVELAAIENSVEPSAVTGTQRSRIYNSLIQIHLEKLHEIDAVKYDSRSKQVASGDTTAGLAEIIRQVESSCYSRGSELEGEGDI